MKSSKSTYYKLLDPRPGYKKSSKKNGPRKISPQIPYYFTWFSLSEIKSSKRNASNSHRYKSKGGKQRTATKQKKGKQTNRKYSLGRRWERGGRGGERVWISACLRLVSKTKKTKIGGFQKQKKAKALVC